jgi:hypothetical protein
MIIAIYATLGVFLIIAARSSVSLSPPTRPSLPAALRRWRQGR